MQNVIEDITVCCYHIHETESFEIIKLLHKIISNLLHHPNEQKYKILKLDNKSVMKLYERSYCKKLLSLLGFQVCDSEWKLLNVDNDIYLSIANTLLDDLFESKSSNNDNNLVQPSVTTPSTIPTTLNEEGQSSLHIAAATGNLELCKSIVETNPELISQPDNNGW